MSRPTRVPLRGEGPTFELIRGDVRSVEIPRADAVYADPPYYGSEKLYDCEMVQLADLIPVMEQIAPIRALSMSQGMLDEAKDLIDGPGRTCPWVKPWVPMQGHPAITWEPVLLWGALPSSRAHGGKLVRDSLVAKAGGDNPSPFPTPKPDRFAAWVCDLLGVGIRPGSLIADLFSGSGSISRAAMLRGWSAVGVDAVTVAGVWTGLPEEPIAGPLPIDGTGVSGIRGTLIRRGPTKDRKIAAPVGREDPDWCPASLRGFPRWPAWSSNRHQWRPVNRRLYLSRDKRPRKEVPGFKACSECHLILEKGGSRVARSEVWNGERVFVRVTTGMRKRNRRWLNEVPLTVEEVEASL